MSRFNICPHPRLFLPGCTKITCTRSAARMSIGYPRQPRLTSLREKGFNASRYFFNSLLAGGNRRWAINYSPSPFGGGLG